MSRGAVTLLLATLGTPADIDQAYLTRKLRRSVGKRQAITIVDSIDTGQSRPSDAIQTEAYRKMRVAVGDVAAKANFDTLLALN